MTLQLGYAVSTLIFLAFFCVTLAAQVASRRYHPLFYWSVVVATTTVGTTTSDYLDRTVGLGYVTSRTDEIFYWVTILVSNTLGTALGDFVATTPGLGFERGALVFAALLAFVAAAYFFTSISRSVLFWAAYVLTRPLGATLGDTLTKPHPQGGLEFGRITSSLVIAGALELIERVERGVMFARYGSFSMPGPHRCAAAVC